MADADHETKKSSRRRKRGSGKYRKLVNEISRLVQNEIQKCGKQCKGEELTKNECTPIFNQSENQETELKCRIRRRRRRRRRAKKIEMEESATKTKTSRDSSNDQSPCNSNPSKCVTDISISKDIKRILIDISKMAITRLDPRDSPQSLRGINTCSELSPQNFAFPKSIKRERMREILTEKSQASQRYTTGVLKVNNKNPKYSYVSSANNDEDILIHGYCDRNRAMEKDVVVIQIHPEDKWIHTADGTVQKTAFIVSILEKVHPRTAIGILVYQKEVLKFHPRDPKFPVMTIDPQTLPDKFKEMSNIKKTLFIAKMLNWSTPSQCSGKILEKIGDAGDLEAETQAILLENGLDVTPYDEALYKDFPGPDYVFQETDLHGREDWRANCVFTIDPATAVDLDDAVSCRKLDNGNFQVGVHIADVTYFLEASSPLDKMVSKRATTIYLANTAYHMLPKPLCQLCSLLPGKNRLTFSVIWELTPTGDVVNHRFTRSIINSCFQMSYQQAQRMIDKPDLDWSEVDLPNIQNGFTASDISQAVNDLFSIANSLRSGRFEGGALKIDQPKVQIILDEATRLPISYCLEERLESNNLIEEFMLLANMTVANHLHKKFPKTALLRHHNPPKLHTLSKTLHPLKNLGVHLDTASAGTLHTSISKCEQAIEKGQAYTEEEFVANCRMMVINSLCAQSMVRANYICSGTVKTKSRLRHYALNVPLYTHFTSPIRRYADCIVHRLLAFDLENTPLPKDWSSELCANLAKNCNKMKDSAKSAQEKSNEIYFIKLIAHTGATGQLAIVMTVRQHNLDIILCHVGLTLKVELSETQNYATVEYTNDDSVGTVKILWKEPEVTQVINVFTILNVRVRKHPKVYGIQATLIPPEINY
ncbi:DIS3-like exonuclease 2 [Fopius arisanus]|uniref:DIS3-like exonuclease 2 n=1 Tax=Fopius arisanus TaxID=64838 RepID=A0A9R1UBN9_9HYME|nr:PREDICTED: DIS3-like exonuclease 2 [Fopius arisanus]